MEDVLKNWGASLVAAAGEGASLDLLTAGNIPILNAGGKAIPLTRAMYDEAQQLGISPEAWVKNHIGGELLVLSAQARSIVRAGQIANLRNAAASNSAITGIPVGPELQGEIDRLQAAWNAEDAAAAAAVDPRVTGTPAPPDVVLPPVGTKIIDPDGTVFEIQEWPFGSLKVRLRATTVAPTNNSGAASERADFITYLKNRLMQIDEPLAQAELIAALGWLSKKPK